MKPVFVLFLAVACAGCDQDIDAPSTYDRQLITQANADSVHVAFTDYDKVRLTHWLGGTLKSLDFYRIGIGVVDSGGYRELQTSEVAYDIASGLYTLIFDFERTLDSSKVETSLVVRYYRVSSGVLDVTLRIRQYQYPYARSEFFIDNSVLTAISNERHYQDIDRIGDKFYFHPTGSQGLFEHDLSTGVSRYLLPYTSGDHIAADSIYVFCDVGHNSIRRYDLADGAVDLVVETFPQSATIRGLEAEGGILYAIVERPQGELRRYTYDGQLLDSTAIAMSSYQLTVWNGIAYTTGYQQTIRRLDLASMSLLPSVKAPARNLEGIRFIDDRLYYCDYFKKIVCSVPLQDLQPLTPGTASISGPGVDNFPRNETELRDATLNDR